MELAVIGAVTVAAEEPLAGHSAALFIIWAQLMPLIHAPSTAIQLPAAMVALAAQPARARFRGCQERVAQPAPVRAPASIAWATLRLLTLLFPPIPSLEETARLAAPCRIIMAVMAHEEAMLSVAASLVQQPLL